MDLALTPWFPRTQPAARARRTAAQTPASQPAHQPLGKGATLVVGDAQGATVECLQGSLWLTHDGDCKDLILSPGERYVSTTRRRLLVHALEAAQVRLAR